MKPDSSSLESHPSWPLVLYNTAASSQRYGTLDLHSWLPKDGVMFYTCVTGSSSVSSSTKLVLQQMIVQGGVQYCQVVLLPTAVL